MDVIDENCIEQQKWICAFDPLMKTLAIDEIDKGEEREVKKCWEKLGKARKIPKNNDQKERRPYGAVELEDPKSHMSWTVNGQRLKQYLGGEILKKNGGCRSIFARATRLSPW